MAYHISRTLANTTLLSMSTDNVVQRSPIRTVVSLLFYPAHNLVSSIVSFVSIKRTKVLKLLRKQSPLKEWVVFWTFQIITLTRVWLIRPARNIIKKERNPKNQLMTSSFTELPKISRNDIAKVEFSTEHDPTPVDASLSHSFHSMPTYLIKLLNWVTNDNAFNTGDNPPEMAWENARKKLNV